MLEYLKPLPTHRELEISEAGCIAAGRRQTCHEPTADRIGDDGKHDRYRARLLTQHSHRRRAACHDHVWLERDQFLRIGLGAIDTVAQPAIIDLDIATFRPTEMLELLHECRRAATRFRIVLL